MAENWKGVHDPDNIQEGYFTGLMNSCGYRIKDLRKPIIGIANSYTDVNPISQRISATAWPRAQGCIISCPSVI